MTTEPAVERRHSPIGPSSFERVEACPASAVVALTAIQRPSTTYAAEGTAAHTIFEACFKDGTDPWEYLETGVTVEGVTYPVDTEMVEALTLAVTSARARLTEDGIARTLEAEVALALDGTDMFGTADLYAGHHLPVRVLDLKYGQGVRVRGDAVQLGLYALMGLIRDFGRAVLVGDPDDILAVTTVLQPRGGGAPVSDAIWTREDMRALEARAKAVQHNLDQRTMTYAVGDHCRWCVAVASCPMLAATARDAAASTIVTNTALPIDAETLDRAVLLLGPLDLYAKRVAEAAQAYLEAGGALDNAKLVEKRATRDWIDPDAIVAWLDQHGVEPFDTPKLRSPAQIEKVLPPNLKSAIAPMVKKESSGLTLALITDPRPEVKLTVERGEAALARHQARTILARARPNPENKDATP